ncbi:glycoside hydrolase family 9 protein [Spirochaetia bacterium 38H-sp]|uniref:Glycoside hydrolase family 9 protein n=1 Tax=Rarispira pelagica TaxID=3141764 RepID=A0ABU9UA65_9SPIR
MRIYISHEGYIKDGLKFAVIELGSPKKLEKSYFLIDEDGSKVYEMNPDEPVQVANWKKGAYFSRVDFSSFCKTGRFAISSSGGMRSEFFTIGEKFAENALDDIVFYLKGQRCSGVYDAADRKLPVYGSDETYDVHGGWYDAAGDYGKYLSHLAYARYMSPQQTPLVVWSLLSGLDILKSSGYPKESLNRMQEEALYGADFLMRMQHPNGFFFMIVFARWSHDPAQRELCSYETQKGIKTADYQAGFREGGGMAIAALARAAGIGTGLDFSSGEYLAAAEKGYQHLKEKNTEYVYGGEENIIDEYCALTAAAELYAVSKNSKYLAEIKGWYAKLKSRWQADGWFKADSKGERSFFHASDYGLLYMSILRASSVIEDLEDAEYSALSQDMKDFVVGCLKKELERITSIDNPFMLPLHFVRTENYNDRLMFFFPHKNESGYWWQGENARLASLSAALLAMRSNLTSVVATESFIRKLREHAESLIYWILGLNPFDVCMMQGRGRNNPRYEEGFPNAPGGVCNGITSGFYNEDDIAFLPLPEANDMAQRWRWSEQWIPHGAWLFLALSYYYALGGKKQ